MATGLCSSCVHHRPGQVDNCRINFQIQRVEVDHYVKLIVEACGQYDDGQGPQRLRDRAIAANPGRSRSEETLD